MGSEPNDTEQGDLVEFMRGLTIDHEPDGWPGVRMHQITALCDEIERLRGIEAAGRELFATQGRFNTQIATCRLGELLGVHVTWPEKHRQCVEVARAEIK